MKTVKTAGFTLIELLVVIAIIGILASVVLAGLDSARASARDSSIVSTLNSMRAQAELYRINNGNYGPASNTIQCGVDNYDRIFNPGYPASDQVIVGGFLSIRALNGGVVRCTTANTSAGVYAYAFAARLTSDTSQWWCVDSTGASRRITTTAGALNTAWSTNGLNRICPN